MPLAANYVEDIMTLYEFSGIGEDGSTIVGTFKLVPPPPKPKLLVGIDFPPSETDLHISRYSPLGYHRVFEDSGFPSLITGKLTKLPSNCCVHISWADNFDDNTVSNLQRFLDNLGEFIEVRKLNWQVIITWKHEPMKKVDSATYKSVGPKIAQVCQNYKFVIGNGPILTRYWMDEGGGNPEIYWYDGADTFGDDCYNGTAKAGSGAARYRSPAEMFDTGLSFADKMGVRFLVPEFGAERLRDGGDPLGTLRSKWMYDCVGYLLDAEALAVAWWCVGGTTLEGDFAVEMGMWQGLMRKYNG